MAETPTLLFDLDGTLVDTAPDLVGALFATCDSFEVPRPGYERARREVANGGLGLIRLAFAEARDARQREAHRWFLDYYADHIADESTVFGPLVPLLNSLDKPWGIVTNKPAKLTALLLDALELSQKVGCVVSGDTLSVSKPDPAPLLLAAESLQVSPHHCWYAGDHQRDIDAARNAGMTSIAVGYGYNLEGDVPESWDADMICHTPDALASTLQTAIQRTTP